MKIQTDGFMSKPSLLTLNIEFESLYSQLLEMSGLLINQLNHAIQALNDADIELAASVIANNQQICRYQIDIDDEIEDLIAKFCPVADDLHNILLTSKVAAELKKMGDEIVDFAKLVTVLFDPNTSNPNKLLLADIFTIAKRIGSMLAELNLIIKNSDVRQAYDILQLDIDFQAELRSGFKHQLTIAFHNVRMTSRLLNIMQMIKLLEGCGKHCRNVAEYMIETIGISTIHSSSMN